MPSNQTHAELERNEVTFSLLAKFILIAQAPNKSASIAKTKIIDSTKPTPNGPKVQTFEVNTSPQEKVIPVTWAKPKYCTNFK
jgi:hypothetical protein